MHEGRQNLTGRDLARRAGVSKTSAIRVLPELETTGILDVRPVGNYRLYDLRRDHVLAGPLEALFDDELHADQAMVTFVRQRARDQGHVVKVRMWRSDSGEAFVTLNGRSLAGFRGQLWVERLVEEIENRFGEAVDVAVEARRPSALRGLMD